MLVENQFSTPKPNMDLQKYVTSYFTILTTFIQRVTGGGNKMALGLPVKAYTANWLCSYWGEMSMSLSSSTAVRVHTVMICCRLVTQLHQLNNYFVAIKQFFPPYDCGKQKIISLPGLLKINQVCIVMCNGCSNNNAQKKLRKKRQQNLN